MREKLIYFFTAVILIGKLLCHFIYGKDYAHELELRHFYYSSDFLAHFGLFLTFYVGGIRKQDRKVFLYFAVIYLTEFIYYSLYMFKVCSFESGLESYSIFTFEVYFSFIYFAIQSLTKPLKWLN